MSKETHITCDCPGGGGLDPLPPLWIRMSLFAYRIMVFLVEIARADPEGGQGSAIPPENHKLYEFLWGISNWTPWKKLGVCEQAEHVMSPGIRRLMKTRTNQPMQKYTRCSYKAFKWSKHAQKRKLWVFLQYEGREMYYSDS